MREKKLEIYLFFVLLGIAFFLTFQIMRPYLYALILALIFSVVFHPLHKKILKSMPDRKSLSAFVTILIVFTLVLLPLVFFGIQITDEIRGIYDRALIVGGQGSFLENITNIANNIIAYFAPSHASTPFFDVYDTKLYALNILSWLRSHFTEIFSGLAKFFVNFFIFTIAFFYFIKDGERLRKDLIAISPFKDDRDEAILHKLRVAIVSVVKGSILVALIQGFVSGLGYYLFGLPSFVFWGGVTAVAALVPGLGTSLVVIPAVIYLLFAGSTASALGLLLWGVLAVGFIDNLLGPKFIEQGINIHPLLILLSALGGISFFGPVGFLLGPITISFLFALFDIYRNIITRETDIIHS